MTQTPGTEPNNEQVYIKVSLQGYQYLDRLINEKHDQEADSLDIPDPDNIVNRDQLALLSSLQSDLANTTPVYWVENPSLATVPALPDLADTSFMQSLGDMEVPKSDRRFLLIPITGCVFMAGPGETVTAEPEGLSFFSEDNGFVPGDEAVVRALELGQSLPISDGIAQQLTVVRIV